MDTKRVEVTNIPYEQKVGITYDGGWKLLHDISWDIKAIIFLLILQTIILSVIALSILNRSGS